jgi:DNA-binding transcriptional ArsR family regulator
MSARRDGIAEVEAQARVFDALAHASRRQILVVLHARGDRMSAGDIARRFACSWPTTSRHLKLLQDAGLVRAEREGRERFYHLERDRLRQVAGAWLDHFDAGTSRRRRSASRRRP